MNHKDTLKTARLILRPLTPDDFDAVQSWAGNPVNVRYMSFGPNTEEQTRGFLAQAKPGKDFAVTLKESGAVIGSCGIYPNSPGDTGEAGWILHMDHWKQGYGTELGGELIRYGFEDLQLRRITAPCAAVNYGSYRVMERNGMRREALHRKAFWARLDEKWIDEAVYAILAEEYFDHTAKDKVRYANRGDLAEIKAFDRHIEHPMLVKAIEEQRVLVFQTADLVMGIARWNYFWDAIPFLNMLSVPDGYTHHGVGTELLKYWESEMRAQGCSRVFTSAMAKEQGQHFFRKFGYGDIGTLYDEREGLELIFEKHF